MAKYLPVNNLVVSEVARRNTAAVEKEWHGRWVGSLTLPPS
jgi:hypothetical protein